MISKGYVMLVYSDTGAASCTCTRLKNSLVTEYWILPASLSEAFALNPYRLQSLAIFSVLLLMGFIGDNTT
ncbi:hypothetical protein P8452_41869 [Trifolium repens]|nr:hypothetical protein P8452_41869 [Trifolium repens]